MPPSSLRPRKPRKELWKSRKKPLQQSGFQAPHPRRRSSWKPWETPRSRSRTSSRLWGLWRVIWDAEDLGQRAHARYAASDTCPRTCSRGVESLGAATAPARSELAQPYACREQRTWRWLGGQWTHSRSHAWSSTTDPPHDGWPRGGRIQLKRDVGLMYPVLIE